MIKKFAFLGKAEGKREYLRVEMEMTFDVSLGYGIPPLKYEKKFKVTNQTTKKMKDLHDEDLRDEASSQSVESLKKNLKEKTGIASEVHENSDITIYEVEIPNALSLFK